MSEIRLDFLANFPQNKASNAILTRSPYANIDTFNQTKIKQLAHHSRELAKCVGKHKAHSFDYTSGTFLMLFKILKTQGFNIALASSLHQQSFYATHMLDTRLSWLHPDRNGLINQSGEHSIESALKNNAKAFLIPYINQDLLTCNDLPPIIDQILSHTPDALIIIDISLFLSLTHFYSLHSLPSHPQILYLCNAENIGLMRPSGFLLSSENLLDSHHEILRSFSLTQLLRPHLFESAINAITHLSQDTTLESQDSKATLFELLQSKLTSNISLFAPLELTAPNALSLRFKHIKVRPLIQALSIEKIHIINGQDCLFGNAKPSFVLQAMGYDELSARELVSLSYRHLHTQDIKSIADKLAQAYMYLRQIHL